jgi:folylpolyglutamate synthase/dihydropteroate synthase
MSSTGSNISKDISDHLEFLGFTVEDIGKEKGRVLTAVRDNGSNFFISITGDMALISVSWRGFDLKARRSKEFYNELNNVNKSVYSKWFFEEDDEEDTIILKIEMVYFGYEKKTFGSLVDTLDQEIGANLSNFSNFQK